MQTKCYHLDNIGLATTRSIDLQLTDDYTTNSQNSIIFTIFKGNARKGVNLNKVLIRITYFSFLSINFIKQ